MTKQILAFFFYFIRELTLYSPLTFSLILRANKKVNKQVKTEGNVDVKGVAKGRKKK